MCGNALWLVDGARGWAKPVIIHIHMIAAAINGCWYVRPQGWRVLHAEQRCGSEISEHFFKYRSHCVVCRAAMWFGDFGALASTPLDSFVCRFLRLSLNGSSLTPYSEVRLLFGYSSFPAGFRLIVAREEVELFPSNSNRANHPSHLYHLYLPHR